MQDKYETPLATRYSGAEMGAVFSPRHKFATWRRLWLALAESQQELGLDISDGQIAELKAHVDDIDFAAQERWERQLRHDVMAQIQALGEVCPLARPILHLGATSAYVVDNGDIIHMREGLLLVRAKLLEAIAALADFAEEHQDLACLAYTHFQPAQPTTVGRRATLWLHDLLLDLEELDYRLSQLKLLGCKGASGTAASFLELFNGDMAKVRLLEEKIAARMGFSDCYPVSGQTYSRKIDGQVLNVLSGVAQSGSKFGNDIRLLCHEGELAEPFGSSQVGSSAMAYKRNPMRSERLCSLARYVLAQCANPAYTAASQWLERSLDDSANKRLSVPEAFLATDGLLSLYVNIVSGLTVYPRVCAAHLQRELPFMATENIIMRRVERGGDRQTLHELIRGHAIAAAERLREQGGDNDLLARLAADPALGMSLEELQDIMESSSLTGFAAQATAGYVQETVRPLLAANEDRPRLPINIEV